MLILNLEKPHGQASLGVLTASREGGSGFAVGAAEPLRCPEGEVMRLPQSGVESVGLRQPGPEPPPPSELGHPGLRTLSVLQFSSL